MEILTWFGRVDPSDQVARAMLAREGGGGFKSPAISQLPLPDLRALAKACGFAADDGEYNGRCERRP